MRCIWAVVASEPTDSYPSYFRALARHQGSQQRTTPRIVEIEGQLSDEQWIREQAYPKKAGREEWHHIKPRYLGGSRTSQQVSIARFLSPTDHQPNPGTWCLRTRPTEAIGGRRHHRRYLSRSPNRRVCPTRRRMKATDEFRLDEDDATRVFGPGVGRASDRRQGRSAWHGTDPRMDCLASICPQAPGRTCGSSFIPGRPPFIRLCGARSGRTDPLVCDERLRTAW